MRRSEFFLPTSKDTPAEAEIASHRLMLRAGLVRQSSAGIYTWLPMGLRVLRKIEAIVRAEQDASGALELLMPTIQSADLWRKSGRYDDYGKEMLRISDRHEREMLYGPTNEELITDIVASDIQSYRDLPKNFYHIQWKFRDEVRPRFGVMRGREFLMKDAYSFDLDEAGARRSYNKMFVAYLRTFAALGLKVVPMRADTGPIGGDLSHEFLILAETGESAVYCDKAILDLEPPKAGSFSYDDDLQPVVDSWTGFYTATDEMHDAAACPVPADALIEARGIEVGHIFYFGTKYSEPMGAKVQGPDGTEIVLQMGSYGIGVSRLVGAIIEAGHDEAGIVWPTEVAPYQIGLINLKVGDEKCDALCDAMYTTAIKTGVDILYDDRDERAGAKFADMNLIGIPWQIAIGPRGLEQGFIELTERKTGNKQEVWPDMVKDFILNYGK